MIKEFNQNIPKGFDNFVPNYKSLATIDQMFSLKTSPRERIMLESKLISFMTEAVDIQQADNVDSLIVAKFVEKFNNKYDNELLDEQKELLNQYILSFTDNSLGLKTFLNSEIGRLKEELNNSFDTKEISEDENMTSKTKQVVEKLTAFSKLDINEEILLTVLKTQELVKEIYSDGTNS